MLRTEPELAAREIARQMGISRRAVEKQIAKLRHKAGSAESGLPKVATSTLIIDMRMGV